VSAFRRELRGTGWRNLLAASIGVGLGIPSYTPVASLFLRGLEQQFGWSKAAAAGAMIALPAAAVVLPFVGMLIDRYGVRLVSGLSVLGSVFALVWLARLHGGLPEYYAATIALNVLGCATGPVAYTRLVATQFRETRGTALAIAQFGIAGIAVVMPLVMGAVMARQGWRGAYLLLAGSSLLGGVFAQVLMRPAVAAPNRASAAERPIFREPAFWQLGLATFAISTGSLGLVSQFQSVLMEHGLSAMGATRLLSLLAASVMLSRLGVGRLLDLWNPNRGAAMVYLAAAAGAALLSLSGSSLPVAAISIVLLGLSIGAELDVLSYFCARLFGTEHYGRNYGMLSMFLYVGIATGSVGFGAIHDSTGSYAIALIVTAALLLVTAALFWMLPGAPHCAEIARVGVLEAERVVD
jgi:predicted MFS family arabinose efflux permease